MIRKAVLAIAGASLAQTASGQLSETAPGSYTCEAAAGQTSRADVSDFFGPGPTMAVRVRLVGVDPAEGAVPTAGMRFKFDSGEEAAMEVYAPRDAPDSLFVILRPPGSEDVYGMIERRRSSTVEISATMVRGAIFVRVGNERGQIHVEDRTLATREIACSGGRFEIELTRDPRPPRRM
jgi:hypothetical protein